MSQPNPMVPSTDWGQAARQFAEATGGQAVLCLWCVRRGDLQPPSLIIYLNGTSYCPDHAMGAESS